MKEIINVKDLCYQKNGVTILDSISLNIFSGEFVCIGGPSGSGKSCLIRCILGLNSMDSGVVLLCGKKIGQNNSFSNVGFVLEDCSSLFSNEGSVYDQFFSILKDKNLSSQEINKRIDEISRRLSIGDMLNYIPSSLSPGNKQLILLAAALIIKPKILFIDDSFDMLEGCLKEKIFKMLKSLQKKDNLTILYVTQNLEDALYADRILLMSEGKFILDEKLENAFIDEKKFNEIGLSLPFSALLSKKLEYYDLVDYVELNMEKLVDALWK